MPLPLFRNFYWGEAIEFPQLMTAQLRVNDLNLDTLGVFELD